MVLLALAALVLDAIELVAAMAMIGHQKPAVVVHSLGTVDLAMGNQSVNFNSIKEGTRFNY